jgi:hypothetical protein
MKDEKRIEMDWTTIKTLSGGKRESTSRFRTVPNGANLGFEKVTKYCREKGPRLEIQFLNPLQLRKTTALPFRTDEPLHNGQTVASLLHRDLNNKNIELTEGKQNIPS